jgi:hypothetical protein
MSRPSLSNYNNDQMSDYNNDQMCFALMPNDFALGLTIDGVWDRTKANLKNSVRLTLRKTHMEESEHSLYVLVNSMNFLLDPLDLIREAVEEESGSIKSYDVAKRQFKVHTVDGVLLDIFILGEAKIPKPDGEESEEEQVEEKEDTVVTKVLNAAVKKNVVDGLRSSVEDSESNSDYKDFSDQGLTQYVGQLIAHPFQLPDV